MGNTGYSNEIKVLKRQIEALEKQVVFLASIDTKLTTQTDTSTSEATADKLIQEFSRSILEDVVIQLKIMNRHWEKANGEEITEQDL